MELPTGGAGVRPGAPRPQPRLESRQAASRQRPSGVGLASGRPFSTGLCWAGRGGHTPSHGCRRGDAGPVGGASRGGSGAQRSTVRGLAATLLPKVALRGALKFLMKLCEGKGRRLEMSPQDQVEGGRSAQGAGLSWSARRRGSLPQWLQLRRQVAACVDAVGDAVLQQSPKTRVLQIQQGAGWLSQPPCPQDPPPPLPRRHSL